MKSPALSSYVFNVQHCPPQLWTVQHCPPQLWNVQRCPPALHCFFLHFPCTVLHYPALSYTILLCPELSCTVLHYLALSCTILRCPALSRTILHCSALFCTRLHCSALSCTVQHYPALFCTILHCPDPCTVLNCPAVHKIQVFDWVQVKCPQFLVSLVSFRVSFIYCLCKNARSSTILDLSLLGY